jgi:hypothetical protein
MCVGNVRLFFSAPPQLRINKIPSGPTHLVVRRAKMMRSKRMGSLPPSLSVVVVVNKRLFHLI